MKKSLPVPPWVIRDISVAAVVTMLVLHLWYRSGGPAWTGWLALFFLAGLLSMPVFLWIFGPQASMDWFSLMRFRRRDGSVPDPILWQRLSPGDRNLYKFGLFVMAFMGLAMLWLGVSELIQ